MRTSLRKLAALVDQLTTSKVHPDEDLELIDNKYSTTVMRGNDPVAALYKRSKDVALEESEAAHLQQMKHQGDERPENQ